MTMMEPGRLQGRDLTDADGDRVGRIHQVWADTDTGQPEWVTVSTGWFGSRVSFVPLEGLTDEGDAVRARYPKDVIKDAPHVEADGGQLSRDEEETLYRHYGMMGGTATGMPGNTMRERGLEAGMAGNTETSMTGTEVRGASATGRAGTESAVSSTADSNDDAVTRSEEELRVRRTQREAGTARLRKWIETEHVTRTEPVRREQVRVETEPITDANRGRATSGPELRENVVEVPLMEEEVVAETEVVPKERVRLAKETVTEEREVAADLRKERVEVEGDVSGDVGGGREGRGRR
jgi:uncharacterized protein (TIGR02271 family)